VEPVLYFVGTPAEWVAAKNRGRLSEEHGSVRFLPRAMPSENLERCWQAPTTLYWAASHHPSAPGADPVRMIAGLDVIPTGPHIFKLLAGVRAGDFAIPLSGAYLPGTRHDWAKGTRELFRRKYFYYPSGFLAARASVWRSVMQVPGDYAKFIRDTGADRQLEPMFVHVGGRWGIDEALLSRRMYELDADPRIAYRHAFYWDAWAHNQLPMQHHYFPKELAEGRWVGVNGAKAGDPALEVWFDELEKHISVWQ
jgi:hypothetical protein